jgi:hypothetical protein
MRLRVLLGLRGAPAATFAAALAVVFAVGLVRAPAAAADQLVNVTLNIPADVRTNPCNGEFVNLSGQLHIVYYVRADNSGGYHLTQQTNEAARGTGLTSGATYSGSEDTSESWYSSPPYPQVYTTTHSLMLASNGAQPNFLLQYAIHTTITAAGVPTATVDHVQTKCTG